MGHRDRLLEGSISCLQEKGYAATTARDIVDAAGASLASIGYHYGSKEELLDQALVEAVKRWFEPLIALSAGVEAHDLPERAKTAIVDLFNSLPGNRPLVISYLEALVRAERSELLRAQLARSFHELRLALAENLRPTLTEADPSSEEIASVICALFDGLIIQWMIDPSRLPPAEQLARSIEATFAALATPRIPT